MILKASCPECGISTLIEEGQEYRCCGCKIPYEMEPDVQRCTPEEIAEWDARP